MLPRFPKIEELRHQTNLQMVEKMADQLSPAFGDIEKHVQFEGRGSKVLRHDDTVGNSPLSAVTIEIKTSPMPLAEYTAEALMEQLRELAEQLAKGKSAYFYSEMEKATTATGNVVDANGAPLSEELILQTFEKIEHRFDADGKWIPPTIIAGKAVIERLLNLSNTDDDRERKFNEALGEILNRKRDDFNRREADRVLAG